MVYEEIIMINFPDLNSLGKKIAGFLLLAVGLAVFIILIQNTIKDFPIWFFGESVEGVVEETWYELLGEDTAGELAFQYFVRYSFTAPNGETITGSTSLSAQEYSALNEGGEVLIVYSSLNPANNRVDDSRFKPLLLCSYIPFIILSWFGLVMGWRLLSSEFKKFETAPWAADKKAN
jgi:hypothetical protein